MTAMNVSDLLDPKQEELPEELKQKNKFLKDNPDIMSKVDNCIQGNVKSYHYFEATTIFDKKFLAISLTNIDEM